MPRLTREQINKLIYDNPDIQEQRRNNPHAIESLRLYTRYASGLLAELAEAGFVVEGVGEMARKGLPYKPVVPILIKWLPSARYLPLADDIVRTLSVRFARSEAVPVFLEMFRNPPMLEDPKRPSASLESLQEHLREVIANGLEIHASPAIAEQLLELAQDRSYGGARSQIVRALPKTKDNRAPEVLMDLLDDPTVAPYAIAGLGRLKHAASRDRIESMLDSSDVNVRTEAKKALKRFDAAAAEGKG